MRVSPGVPCGRKIDLYHPDLFNEHEEVIIYSREEFKNTFTFMREQIDYITRWGASLDPDEGWKVMGYWPLIMERVHILGIDLQSFYDDRSLQTYLDSYMYDGVNVRDKARDKALAETVIEVSDEFGGVSWL